MDHSNYDPATGEPKVDFPVADDINLNLNMNMNGAAPYPGQMYPGRGIPVQPQAGFQGQAPGANVPPQARPQQGFPAQPQAPAGFAPQMQPYPARPLPKKNMDIGDWLLLFFLSCLPVAGLILLIVWAVDNSPENHAKKVWAQATIIWRIILCVVFMSAFWSLIDILISLFI